MNFKPTNRYILLQAAADPVDPASMLVPEEFRTKPRHSQYEVISVASDCTTAVSAGQSVVADNSMIETVEVHDQEYKLVLENYILGVIDAE